MELIEDILQQAGLTSVEAKIYVTLLDNGPQTILQIAQLGHLKRTNLYNLLTNLEHRNLVKKDLSNKTVKYVPNPPEDIEKLLEYKEQLMQHAKLNYDILLNSLKSRYYLTENKPLIDSYEGTKGLQKLYDDVNNTGKDILLIRSHYDAKNKEVRDMTAKQIVAQVKRGIHAKVINPIKDAEIDEAQVLYTKYDKIRLVEERFIVNNNMLLPSQVLIYGNKTSMTMIKEDVITTIIDNEDITLTFRGIFEYMWEMATSKHRELVAKWNQN
jgi:sugar-specific transcriptional regulator TrmB